MSRNIIVLTNNDKKFAETANILTRYGLKPLQHSSDDPAIADLIEEYDATAVIRETSQLFDAHNERIDNCLDPDLHHLQTVKNVGILKTYKIGHDGHIVRKNYKNSIDGYLDFRDQSQDGFGWDRVFYDSRTGMSYHDSLNRGHKNSVRNINLMQWISEDFHYEKPVTYNFINHSVDEIDDSLDFNMDFHKVLRDHDVTKNVLSSNGLLENAVNTILNAGVFSRKALNKPHGNYWLPGMNAGIPQTPKKDHFHEITFLIHDIFHHLPALSDLVYTGSAFSQSETGRKIYSIHRMAGEAITLVFADMIFAKLVQNTGYKYDFSKRKIQPLMDCLCSPANNEEIDINLVQDIQEYEGLFKANYNYALTGDLAGFYAIKKDSKSLKDFEHALSLYTNKYEEYFKADWTWTNANYITMKQHSDRFSLWYKSIGAEFFEKNGISTIDSFAEELIESLSMQYTSDLSRLDDHDLLNSIFNVIFGKIRQSLENNSPLLPMETRKSNSFRRYLMGQVMIYQSYNFGDRNNNMAGAILHSLKNVDLFDENEISKARSFIGMSLDNLLHNGLITEADKNTWSGNFPLYEANYVYYDTKKEDISIRDVFTAIMNSDGINASKENQVTSHQNKYFLDTEKLWQRLSNVPLEKRVSAMIEYSGGSFYDDEKTIIKKHGVSLTAIGGLPVDLFVSQNIDFVQHQKSSMGHANAITYMNPKNRDLSDIFDLVTKRKEYSSAHTASLTFLITGLSGFVCNEFNSQRDIIHLARLTEARTKAQNQPPFYAAWPEIVEDVSETRDFLVKQNASIREKLVDSSGLSVADRNETVNNIYSGLRGGAISITGSIRNFMKLVSALDDQGKEDEYMRILYQLNNILHDLYPEIFKPSSQYQYNIPAHIS